MPHAPQLALSVCRSAQVEPHSGLLPQVHAPLEQNDDVAKLVLQTLPHAPQLVALYWRSTHWPLHALSEPVQGLVEIATGREELAGDGHLGEPRQEVGRIRGSGSRVAHADSIRRISNV